MKSLSQLKEQNENLSRELAESCRHVVDLQFAWNDLHQKYRKQKKSFAKFLLENKHANTMESALQKVEAILKREHEPQELESNIKHENDLY
tara:strand:+ start:16824 stop:17096 length:273 start_codon:yes stop_codon:yes gene_type:complete